jgi:ABC-type multidrug transport system ATPase subunit
MKQPVLILDEPLSGTDVTSAQLFQHLLIKLARSGKTNVRAGGDHL